jgi:uncharacterized protein YkwD
MKLIIILFLPFCFGLIPASPNYVSSTDQIQLVLLGKINDYRLKKKLVALQLEEGLAKSAENQCSYLLKIGKLSHSQPKKGYRTTKDRILVFSTKTYMSYGENCLKTYADLRNLTPKKTEVIAEEMFELWRTSKPHNDNLLNRRFTHAGFGFQTKTKTGEIYCVLDFGGD